MRNLSRFTIKTFLGTILTALFALAFITFVGVSSQDVRNVLQAEHSGTPLIVVGGIYEVTNSKIAAGSPLCVPSKLIREKYMQTKEQDRFILANAFGNKIPYLGDIFPNFSHFAESSSDLSQLEIDNLQFENFTEESSVGLYLADIYREKPHCEEWMTDMKTRNKCAVIASIVVRGGPNQDVIGYRYTTKCVNLRNKKSGELDTVVLSPTQPPDTWANRLSKFKSYLGLLDMPMPSVRLTNLQRKH